MSEVDVNRELGAIWMELFRDLSRAAERASQRLSGVLQEDLDEVPGEIRSRWGRRVMRLDGIGLERGMTTAEISTAIGLNDPPNADKVLVQLEKDGRIELVAGSSPKQWRLDREQRRDRILRVSRLIPRGRWTTYGDVAVAVSGNVRVARAVSRVAARNPAFANPHRVLAKGGTIPPGWKDDEGNGPEECERRLREEGITLTDGRAPRELRLSHDDLQALLAASEGED